MVKKKIQNEISWYNIKNINIFWMQAKKYIIYKKINKSGFVFIESIQ